MHSLSSIICLPAKMGSSWVDNLWFIVLSENLPFSWYVTGD